MRLARTIVLVVAVVALVAWPGSSAVPGWLVVVGLATALLFGVQAGRQRMRIEGQFARSLWTSLRRR